LAATWVWGKKELDWGIALRVKSKYPSQRRNKASKNFEEANISGSIGLRTRE